MIYQGYRSVISAVSEERGNERYEIFKEAIDAIDFEGFLLRLSEKNNWEPLAIFMDNLGVHKKPNVMKAYETYDIMPIFNTSYAPDFNPIEASFSQVKRHFCSQRLNLLANDAEFDWEKLIKASFTKITP